jgi:predicted acyl esterase
MFAHDGFIPGLHAELSGYMKLRLWVEARPGKAGQETPDDMGLFVAVNNGNPVHFHGSVGSSTDMATRGWVTVAMRQLDEFESTEWNPVPKGTREPMLTPGEIVPVDIALYPSSTFFAAQ